jgi:predicted ATPase/DNA-binding SARP family transcriptional activator
VLEFRILGPLEVRHDGRALELGGPRSRTLLAALLMRAGEPVPADALAQAVWGDEAAPSTASALQVQVSRLRSALGPAAERLETVGGGYRLRVEPGELDADRFELACRRGAELPPREAAAVLREALAMWSGPVLADQRYDSWAQPEIRRLEEMRALALEDRVKADLALGEHARLVGELEALVAEYPLRERLRAQQMLALYRSGRHADALAAYRDARMALDSELGLEPGPELRQLEQAILTHDPSLAAPSTAEPGIPPAPPTPTFGRDDDVRAALDRLADTRLLTLTGPGGVGKTRLAIEVARAAGGRFVSLASTADADRVPALICDTLAVARIPGETDGEALDRSIGRGPILLVLDNLEHLPDAAPLLADLLERHPALRMLTTSRQPVGIRAEQLFPVPPLMPGADAAMFAERARARDPAFALSDANRPAVVAICERLAGLPLAIELAAARLGVLTPSDLAERLSGAVEVLAHGPRDAAPRHRTLRATLDWSFDLLDVEEQQAFTALGAFAGGCLLDAAEAVTGAGLDVFESLVAKSLVTARHGRLGLLEPVRQYAAERLAGRPDVDTIYARHCAHYRALAERAETELLVRGRSAPAFTILNRERDNVDAAVERAFASGRAIDALAIAGALRPYGWLANAHEQVRRWCERALDAVGDDAPAPLRARALHALADNTADRMPDPEGIRAALALFRELGDEREVARCLLSLSDAKSLRGEYEEGRRAAEEALAIARRLGDAALIGEALGDIGLGIDRIEEALPYLREAAQRCRSVGAVSRAARLLSTAGMAALREDAYDRSEELLRDALDAALEVGDPTMLAFVHGNRALAALLGGRPDAARAAFRNELVIAHAHAFETFYMEGLLGFAALAAADGNDHFAAVLNAAAWELIDRPVFPSEAPVYERVEQRFIAPARERLGCEAWEAASAAGRRMTADAAIALALEPALLRAEGG